MAWTINITRTATKQLKKMDCDTQQRIVDFLKKLGSCQNPRQTGKALRGDKKALWRFRVGHYRLICSIEDASMTVLVLALGHRKDIYK